VTAYQAREEEHRALVHSLCTQLRRLALDCTVLADDLTCGNPLRPTDARRMEMRVQSLWEAMALERAGRVPQLQE
jgi:hypothetical protein